MRKAAPLLLLAYACARSGVPDAGPNDAAGNEDDAGVRDTGVDIDGPLSGEVAIATWNLENFPKTATTANRVHDILLSVAPDLIGVEEIAVPADFTRFAAQLPGYVGIQVDDPGNFLRVGLLYRPERVAVTDVEALFDRDGYAFPRPPLKASVTVTSTAGDLFDFVMVVVHLKAQVDTDSRERRRAANEALDAWIRSRMASGSEKDFVVVGDFNDAIDDAPGDNVFQVYLDQPELYYFLTTPVAMNHDVSYIPFPGLIDHILVTTDALYEYGDGTTEVLHLDESVPAYQALVSDHRPVLARFRIHAPQ